ncbi:TonB-dependent siderophore receptor [Blastomonas sp. UPD001]|uniref:TonB-dependent siderophore receptor n=1 Tax=Blastomonas sp. UPD001 TaxID=2217673 RepID=UPI000E34D835|nr:TonB-dependent siderophore receptor [Blastomonas sp. UPD001]
MVPSFRSSFLLGSASAIGSLLVVTPAYAQASDSDTAQQELEQSAQSDSIIVTGYRGSPVSSTVLPDKPVLDTPFSVNSLGSELLRDQQAISFADVARNDPSLVLAFPQFDDTVNIRGFYQNLIYREGLPTSAQVRVPFQNKDRIDVFKGLSGFRFGFNSPGGVINVVSKRPTETFSGFALFGGDHHGTLYGQLDAGGRFGPDGRFGVRVNLFVNEIDSFRRNVKGEQRLYSGIFDWRVTPDLTLEAEYERFENSNNVFGLLFNGAFGGDVERARALLPLVDPEDTNAQPWLVEDRSQSVYRLGASWRFAEGWTARLSGHKVDADVPYTSGEANDLQPDGSYTLSVYTIESFKPSYKAVSAGVDGTFSLLGIGAALSLGYIYDDRSAAFRNGYFFADASEYLGGTRRGNLFTGETILGFVPPPGTPGSFEGAFASRRHTAFVNATLSVNDRLDLLGGVTYATLRGYNPDTGEETFDDDAWSPVLGVVWKPLDRTSLYASYATGLEEGQTPPETAANFRPEPFPPIKSEQIELGVKHEFGRGALVTLAAFQIDQGLAYVNSANLFVQDGVRRHRGVEFTVLGNVTHNLRLAGGVTYLDAKVAEAAENVGSRIPGIGKWRYSLFADWRTPLDPNFYVTGGVQGDSRKFVTFANNFALPGHTIFDLGARYTFDTGATRMTARVGVQNLLDKRHFESVDFYGGLIFGQARTLRASLEVAF